MKGYLHLLLLIAGQWFLGFYNLASPVELFCTKFDEFINAPLLFCVAWFYLFCKSWLEKVLLLQ
jgi:hypothetical protein